MSQKLKINNPLPEIYGKFYSSVIAIAKNYFIVFTSTIWSRTGHQYRAVVETKIILFDFPNLSWHTPLRVVNFWLAELLLPASWKGVNYCRNETIGESIHPKLNFHQDEVCRSKKKGGSVEDLISITVAAKKSEEVCQIWFPLGGSMSQLKNGGSIPNLISSTEEVSCS